MIFRLNQSDNTHTDTTWYVVHPTQLDDYETNNISITTTSGAQKNILSINIPNSDNIYVIAIKTLAGGVSEKVGPIKIENLSLEQMHLNELFVEPPQISIQSSSNKGDPLNMIIKSSSIRPSSAQIDKVIWSVVHNKTGEMVYSKMDTNNYTLQLDDNTGLLGIQGDITIYCIHISKQNVCSKPSHVVTSIGYNNSVITFNNNINPSAITPIYVTLTNASLISTDFIIFDTNNKPVFAGSDSIPSHILDFSSDYMLAIEVNYSTSTNPNNMDIHRIPFYTTEELHRSDIVLTDDPIIKDGTGTESATGLYKSLMLINGNIINGNIQNPNTIPISNNGVDVSLISVNGPTLENIIESIHFSIKTTLISSYNKDTNKLVVAISSLSNNQSTVHYTSSVEVDSQSSNAIPILANSFMYVYNNKIMQYNIKTDTHIDIIDIPATSYDNSNLPFRVEMINENELYIVTNIGAILLYNRNTSEFNILNSFTPQDDFITATLSDGGLFIANGKTKTVIYDRKNDTVTETDEIIYGIMIEVNGEITKLK